MACHPAGKGSGAACGKDARQYREFMRFPDRAGVMILDGCPLFPQAMVPLFIFEPRYRRLLEDALGSERMMCLAMRQPGSSQERPCKLAGLGLIRASVKNPNGTSNLVLQGVSRVRLGRAVRTKPYRVHLIEPVVEESPSGPAVTAQTALVLELVAARLRMGISFPLSALLTLVGSGETKKGSVRIEDCLEAMRGLSSPGVLADVVATLFLSDAAMRQIVLQTVDVEERLRHVAHFLMAEIHRLQKNPVL